MCKSEYITIWVKRRHIVSHPRHTAWTPRKRPSAADRIAASLWRRRPITTGILMKQCEREIGRIWSIHRKLLMSTGGQTPWKPSSDRVTWACLLSTLLVSLGLMPFNQRSPGSRNNTTSTCFGEQGFDSDEKFLAWNIAWKSAWVKNLILWHV